MKGWISMSQDTKNVGKLPPALTREERENQLTALSYDAVEERIKSGKATSQELIHFLKLGSTRERQEREKMAKEIELLNAKIEDIQQSKVIEELYGNAINAMRLYSGADDGEY